MKFPGLLCAVLVIALGISGTAQAVTCYEVKTTFDPTASGENSGRIRASGWGKFSAFQQSRPVQGWFKFNDNTRVYAVNNGTLSTLQWNVDMDSARPADDCDPVIPAPRNAGDAVEPTYIGYFSTGCVGTFGYFWRMSVMRESNASFYIVIGSGGGGGGNCTRLGPPQQYEEVW